MKEPKKIVQRGIGGSSFCSLDGCRSTRWRNARITLAERRSYETVAGLIHNELNRIPSSGETVNMEE